MHQLINKKKVYFYIFSFLVLSSILNVKFLENVTQKFLVKEIFITNNNLEIKKKILNKTEHLINKNIFQIKKNDIEKEFYDLNYLENITVKKKYPSTIKIEAIKTKLIGITFINQKKYYIGSNGQFILFEKISNNKKLPFIFGEFDISKYLELIKILNNQNINQSSILKFYFHKNKRWDLYFENNILIKLPNQNLNNAINIYKNFKKENDIEKNKTIDLRVKNRIIVNNEK